jgi:hypothetical protein
VCGHQGRCACGGLQPTDASSWVPLLPPPAPHWRAWRAPPAERRALRGLRHEQQHSDLQLPHQGVRLVGLLPAPQGGRVAARRRACVAAPCAALAVSSDATAATTTTDPPPPHHHHTHARPQSPDGGVTRDEVSALSQLELVLAYQRHWCEHKPSGAVATKCVLTVTPPQLCAVCSAARVAA